MCFVLSIVGAKAATAKYACVEKKCGCFLSCRHFSNSGPKAFLNGYRIYVVACVFDPCFWWYFISDDVISFSVTRVQRKQISRIRWYGRALETLVIVIDHRLICELPRFCGKQECGDVGISTPNTLQCMHCHTTAPHGLVWFDVRTSRLWNFSMFFSLSNFLNSSCCWTSDHTALVSD